MESRPARHSGATGSSRSIGSGSGTSFIGLPALDRISITEADNSCTCCFSTMTVTSCSAFLAWMKNVRSPAGPTASAVMRSTGSSSMSMLLSSHPRRRPSAGDQVPKAPRVVHADDAGDAVAQEHRGDRRGADDDPLEQVQMHAGVLGEG